MEAKRRTRHWHAAASNALCATGMQHQHAAQVPRAVTERHIGQGAHALKTGACVASHHKHRSATLNNVVRVRGQAQGVIACCCTLEGVAGESLLLCDKPS